MSRGRGGRPGTLAAADLLFTQGFGTRRACHALVRDGALSVAGRVVTDPDEALGTDGLVFEVNGQPWPWQERAVLLLHKPAGCECSQRPGAWPSVLELLPAPLRAAACSATSSHGLELTLTEGKYHQVKRMVAAAGNHVESLHRSAFGPLTLADGLPPGRWRWLTDAELSALEHRPGR